MPVTFAPFDPETDADALVTFLSTNTFPFHVGAALTPERARERVASYWSGGRQGLWVIVDGSRVGTAVLDDLEDIADGGAPLFDLRLQEQSRSRGLGVPVLRALTSYIFQGYPAARRLEGQTREDNIAMRRVFVRSGWVKEAHHREAWPVEGGDAKASIVYAVLRRDWDSGTITPVDWDDLPATGSELA